MKKYFCLLLISFTFMGCNATPDYSHMSLEELQKEENQIYEQLGNMDETMSMWYLQQAKGQWLLKDKFGITFCNDIHKTRTPFAILKQEKENLQKFWDKHERLEKLGKNISKEIKRREPNKRKQGD